MSYECKCSEIIPTITCYNFCIVLCSRQTFWHGYISAAEISLLNMNPREIQRDSKGGKVKFFIFYFTRYL